MAECHLLAGVFGYAVQGILFLLALGSLVVKKITGPADRTWYMFSLDSSKQLAGAGWIHILNLLFAHHLAEHFNSADTDACDWYAVNIIVDCTLGVFVEYLLLGGLLVMLAACLGENNGFESGEYRDESGAVDYCRYVKQLGLWLFIVSCMKVSMMGVMYLGHNWLVGAADVLYGWFDNEKAKLLAVMVFTPWVMNSFQFWMVDNIIRKKDDDDYASCSSTSEGVELRGAS